MEDHMHHMRDIRSLIKEMSSLTNDTHFIIKTSNTHFQALTEHDAQISELRRRIDRLEQNKCC